MKVDLILLANTTHESVHQMNLDCIHSCIAARQNSDAYQLLIYLIETNPSADFSYPETVRVIKPGIPFNFHQFMNIGIRNSSSEWVVLSNNDVVFKPGWLEHIFSFAEKYPEYASFSPIDYNYRGTPFNRFPNEVEKYDGYLINKHVAGWCIVVKRTIFSQIGMLDERFDFYYADNDYAMTLQKYGIKHGLIPRSEASHLWNKSTPPQPVLKIPACWRIFFLAHLHLKKNQWISSNKNMLRGYYLFHMKWGSTCSIKIRQFLFNRWKHPGFSRFLFSDFINLICSLDVRLSYWGIRKFIQPS